MSKYSPSPQSFRDRLHSSAVTIIRNTTSLLFSQLIRTAVTIVLFALVARYLGVEQLGVYALAMTGAEIASVFLDFGLNYLTTREVARQSLQFRAYLGGAIVFKSLLAGIIVIGLTITLPLVYQSPEIRQAVYLGVISAIFRSFRDLFTSFINGLERMSITALLLSFQAIVWLIAGVYTLRFSQDVLSLLYARLAVDGGFAITSLVVLLRIRQFPLSRPKVGFLYQLIKLSLPFGLFVTGAALYSRIDTVVLSVVQGETSVGVYEAGRRLIMVVEMIPALFSLALYPTLSRILSEQRLNARRLIHQSVRYMIMLGLPIAIGTVLTAPKLLSLVYDANFGASVMVLQIMGLAIPVRYCAHILGTILLASDNSGARARGAWLATIISVGLNLLLIPRFGPVGAAAASIVTSVILTAFYYQQASLAHQINVWDSLRPALAASIGMAIIITLTETVPLFLLVGLAGLSYTVFLVVFRGLSYSDYLFLKELMQMHFGEAGCRDTGVS